MKRSAASTQRTGQPRCAQRLGDRDVGRVAVVECRCRSRGCACACTRSSCPPRRCPGSSVIDHGNVVVVGELVDRADAFPAVRRAFEDRPDREAERGQRERRGGDRRRRRVGGAGHEPPARDRLALERAGDLPIERVLGLVLCVLVGHRLRTISRRDSGRRRDAPRRLCASPRSPRGRRRRRAPWRACGPRLSPSRRRVRRPPTRRRPAAGSPAPCASALSVIVSASSATAAVSPSATSRASPIAYSRSPASSPRSASAGRTHARGAVVQQVALVDRLDQQLVLLAPARRARARGGELRGAADAVAVVDGDVGATSVAISPPSRAAASRSRSSASPSGQRFGATGDAHRRHAMASSANAAAAASTVRSICSAVCASEGNHASNCEGGG